MKKRVQPPVAFKLLEYFKYLALSSNIAVIKLFSFLKLKSQNSSSKSQQINNLPTNILNKIYRSYTWTTNKYFVIVIILSIFTAIALSYYGQHYHFNQQLKSKTEYTRLRIEKTIKDYHTSLRVIAHIMLDEKRYLDTNKVLRLLKLTYTTDPNIKLFHLTWHPSSEPNRAYSAFGPCIKQQNQEFVKKLSKNFEPLYVYNETNLLGEDDIDIILPVNEEIQDANNLDQTNKSNLLGYLKLPVTISLFLQNIQYIVKDDDLVKFSAAGHTLYYSQQNEKFVLNKFPEISEYQFADEISFASPLYKISIGSNKQQILNKSIETAQLSCIIILCIGGLMLLIYNLVERKKFQNSYSELSTQELANLEHQVENLTFKLALSSQENEQLAKQNQNYLDSMQAINAIEQQIKQAYSSSLRELQEHLLLKQYDKEEKLTPEIIKQMFADLYKISENLLHNVYNAEKRLTETDLSSIFIEVLTLFSPVIDARSLQILSNIGQIKIQTNELVLKQIIINLLARSLGVTDNGGSITISADREVSQNSITIEISDNGFSFNENFLKNVLQNNDLVPGMAYISLEFKAMEAIVKQILQGDLKITNIRNKGNRMILLLPIEHNRADNVTPFPKIAAR